MQGRKDVFRRIERQYFRDRMSELGLSTVEGMLVRALGQQGETRQEDLVVNMVLDKGAVARAMAHLEQLDLVQRTVSGQCRREKLVYLTAAGAEKAGEIRQIMEEWNRVCYHGFTPEERALFEQFLTRVTENVRQYKQGESKHG